MKIAIIGATGKMGAWFCQEFAKQGHQVTGIGRNASKLREVGTKFKGKVTTDYRIGLAGAKWILVAVPIDAIMTVVESIAPLAPKDAIIFDILSVKGNVLPHLGTVCQGSGVQYVSVHPMFGPGANNLTNQNVIITPVLGHEKAAARARDFFSKMGARVTEAEGELHDKMMALVLNLPHFLNILFGKFLVSSGFDLPSLKQFGGTTFALQQFLSLNVNAEDPAIYGPLQFENPAFLQVLKELRDFLGQYLEVVEKKDASSFDVWMKGNDQFFKADPLYSKAYPLFYRLLDLLR
jgi:prephenate dehydrogenase